MTHTVLTLKQKLAALALRFYQGHVWTPRVGDFYTTSRADLELYRVVKIEGGIVYTEYCTSPGNTTGWNQDAFLTEGFGIHRVYVPDWILDKPEPAAEYPSPPQLSITWYDTPEEVHRAMWEESAKEAGLTYEGMIAESEGLALAEDGSEVVITHDQEMEGIKAQKCWAFVDTRTNVIHAWAAKDVDEGLLLHMLAHEVGHATGTAEGDFLAEEMRADQYGKVAAEAFRLMEGRTA